MMTHVFRSLKAIAKHLTALLIAVVMLFSLSQTAVLAADSRMGTGSMVVPSDAGMASEESVSDEDFGRQKAERRQWQSKASSIQDKSTRSNSAGTTLQEKLNLDEITEGYDPDKEAAKRSAPTP